MTANSQAVEVAGKSKTLNIDLTRKQYQAWLDEPVDWDFHGKPISRRVTYPYIGQEFMGAIPFAAGYAAADLTGAQGVAEVGALRSQRCEDCGDLVPKITCWCQEQCTHATASRVTAPAQAEQPAALTTARIRCGALPATVQPAPSKYGSPELQALILTNLVEQGDAKDAPSFVVGTCKELNDIHAVIMDIGGDWPEVAGDPYTLAHVKEMARELRGRKGDAKDAEPARKPLAQLKFFRDLSSEQRLAVLRPFKVIPPGAEDEIRSHYTEKLLFNAMWDSAARDAFTQAIDAAILVSKPADGGAET